MCTSILEPEALRLGA
jgi:hypothetical protein